jgi:CCR4-NOT transcription complex subunit 7/8
VQRIGPQHQAGSDSLLTAAVFFRIRSTFFDNNLDDDYYKCVAIASSVASDVNVLTGRNYLYGFSSGRHGKVSPGATGAGGLLTTEKPY